MELARGLARRLGVEVQLVGHPTPPKAVECVKTAACDLVIVGIEPSRAAEVDFSQPVIQFDYTYLVPAGSSIGSIADVDRPGIRIAVLRNHASTFALSRIVKHAELVAAEVPDTAFDCCAPAMRTPSHRRVRRLSTIPSSCRAPRCWRTPMGSILSGSGFRRARVDGWPISASSSRRPRRRA
jgi:hypothetical protein